MSSSLEEEFYVESFPIRAQGNTKLSERCGARYVHRVIVVYPTVAVKVHQCHASQSHVSRSVEHRVIHIVPVTIQSVGSKCVTVNRVHPSLSDVVESGRPPVGTLVGVTSNPLIPVGVVHT